MSRTFSKLATFVFVLVITTMACGDSTPIAPGSPDPAANGSVGAAPDGSTLKATAPTLVSPINNQEIDIPRPTLQLSPSTARFGGSPSFSYEFQLLNASGGLLRGTTISGTSWTVPEDLQSNTTYQWRGRAVLDGAVGPWAANATFRMANAVPGCINGRLLDPKAYFFHLIGRREGDSARDWEQVLRRSGLPAGPVAGQRTGSAFYGLSQQIDSSGNLRGRIFLPTEVPNAFGYFIKDVEILSDPSGTRWIWNPFGEAPYAPRACP